MSDQVLEQKQAEGVKEKAGVHPVADNKGYYYGSRYHVGKGLDKKGRLNPNLPIKDRKTDGSPYSNNVFSIQVIPSGEEKITGKPYEDKTKWARGYSGTKLMLLSVLHDGQDGKEVTFPIKPQTPPEVGQHFIGKDVHDRDFSGKVVRVKTINERMTLWFSKETFPENFDLLDLLGTQIEKVNGSKVMFKTYGEADSKGNKLPIPEGAKAGDVIPGSKSIRVHECDFVEYEENPSVRPDGTMKKGDYKLVLHYESPELKAERNLKAEVSNDVHAPNNPMRG